MKNNKYRKIVLLFRNNTGGHSVENVFKYMAQYLDDYFEIEIVYLPYSGLGLSSVIKNLLFVSKLKGIIHVTGDIHYVAVFPWKKMVLTIHDLGSLLNDKSDLKRVFKKLFWVWIPVIFTKKITVVSNFTKSELLKLTPWTSSKISVIYNPLLNTKKSNILAKDFDPEFPKILLIGTKTNKNIERTIQSLHGINCELWIVGILSQFQISLLAELEVSYKNYVNISNSELFELYQSCDIISFISLYEGFGLPLIEGQTFGKVVITSSIQPMIEVAGSGAVFVNPLNIRDMKNGFLSIIEDEKLRIQCVNNGYINIERFKPDKIVKEYIRVYSDFKK